VIDPGLGLHSQWSRHAEQFRRVGVTVNYKLQSLTPFRASFRQG
jgi:hypothetical protein